MFAVIKTGGKQYRVTKDDMIVVETVAGEPGSTVRFEDVLMIGDDGKAPSVGTPFLEQAAVFAEVVQQTRGDKIIVFKKKRRKGYRRKHGHRQALTVLRITDISPTGTKADTKSKAKAKPKKPAKTAPAAKTEAKRKTAAKPKAKKEPKAGKGAAKAPAKASAGSKE
ncbi:MAG: 50S ribosomal protein L21 [Alphaproteobacteria bacterium]|nr:50S ribosomal protein L21 [Alphaproteobacteria bacterium]